MHRAAVAILVGGYAFGGIGSGLGHQPVIFGASLAVAGPAKGMKTVEYQGLQIRVPAPWPVYFLNKDPNRCVRYDINAVYLGTPGTSQHCPPGLVGRTDTVSIGGQAGPAGQPDPMEGKPAAADAPAAPGTIWQDAQQHEFAVTVPDAAPAITATYGTAPDLIKQMLASVRQIASVPPPAPAPAAYWGWSAPQPLRPAAWEWPAPQPPRAAAWEWSASQVPPSPQRTAPPQASPSPQGTPSPQGSPSPSGTMLTGSASPSPQAGTPSGPVAGFDTCTAPALHTMQAWRAKFSAAGIYIGGQMMACDYGNLTASWIRQAEAMGWSLLPAYVGPQAPCDSFSGKINPKRAAAQGIAAANWAVADAAAFGLGKGSPIYYDMEAYDHTKAGCVTAVLTFLDAWTRKLNALGYVSGVYSSAGAAVIDLQSATRIAGHWLARPQAIWFALWDKATNLAGSPYMTPAVWATSARSKQYAGPHVVKVAGISLEIDSDLVNGPVARR